MAHSVVAAIVAQLANEYPEISRVLLINPAVKLKPDDIRSGLSIISDKQVIVLIGSKDPSISDVSEIIGNNAKVIVIDGADHHFPGDVFQTFIDSPNTYLFD